MASSACCDIVSTIWVLIIFNILHCFSFWSEINNIAYVVFGICVTRGIPFVWHGLVICMVMRLQDKVNMLF